MESINAMAELIEIMEREPNKAYDFIGNNYYRFDKDELASIIKELLYAIQNDCKSEMYMLLEDAAIELDNQYNERCWEN
jgi:hypothetical protein